MRVPHRSTAVLVLLLLAVPAPAVAAEQLEKLVARAALEAGAALVEAPDRFEISDCRVGPADVPGAGPFRLKLVEVEGPNRSGYARLRFRVFDDAVPRGEVRVTLRGSVRGPVLVADRTLARGREVDAGELSLADEDLTRLSARPLRHATELAGRVPLRTLSRGRLITDDLLMPKPVVRRGETVRLRVRRGAMNLSLKATALSDGATGDEITLKNVSTGARLRGRVLEDGTLQFVDDARGGRP